MRKIQVYLQVGLAGCDRNETLEVDEDLSDDEISEIVQDWAYNYIDYGWRE